MTGKPQTGGKMLPMWWEDQLKRLKGTMRSSRKMSNALNMAKSHFLVTKPTATTLKRVFVFGNEQHRFLKIQNPLSMNTL
ncbi:uncharacterized protein LOC113859009 [Abrus precatorius]|uniref:Uncharacterized protein LOC113859009 n=1 Tax=Abrus precatorius TaxID=3816 RepID=A0A8B8KUR6_ABRPR|nr:uncharacterized protein LOC113859009 [Abrus precatorius]